MQMAVYVFKCSSDIQYRVLMQFVDAGELGSILRALRGDREGRDAEVLSSIRRPFLQQSVSNR